jgi:bacteriorhodopsin
MGRQQLAPQYRPAMVMSAIVVAIAGYHYFRIFESWTAAYALQDGVYVATGALFNDAYRYVDWALTVPLLVAELVAVLSLPRGRARNLTLQLGAAAFAMILLGYPGEIATDNATRALWGFLSTLPFLYIVYVLFTRLGDAVEGQPDEVRKLLRNTRLLLLGTWGFYPIVYMLPFLGGLSAGAIVAVQVGYCLADVAAKCGYGVMIYNIARAKSANEAGTDEPVYDGRATAPAMGD